MGKQMSGDLPSNQMLNQIDSGPDLARVMLPLVRLMRDARLSWSNRELVADAMQECHRHWSSMEEERQMFQQASAASQAGHSL
jgi:hypothetical protein